MIIRGGGKADNQVFFCACCNIVCIIKRALQFVKNAYHFFMLITAVGTMDFINQKHNTHFCKFFQNTLIHHFAHRTELLQVNNHQAGIGGQCCLKGFFIAGFHIHAIVDVHVQHKGINLAPQLQPVHHNHDFVVNVFIIAPQVFQL